MKEPKKEIKDRMLKDIELLRNNEELRKTLQYLKEQTESNIKGIKKSKKRLKNLLKQDGLTDPDIDDLFDIMFYWGEISDQDSDIRKYLSSLPKDKVRLDSIPTDIIYKWSKQETNKIKKESETEKIEVEAYKNIPHILCILDDLGILDLIDEKFSDKHYKGKARETDKAKLIATILGKEDGEPIRQFLKNKDYLSKIAKNRAVKTLDSLGLDSSKFID